MLDQRKNRGSMKPYLRNLNVRWFEFDLNDVLEMPFTDAEYERYTVGKGDVLICEGGYLGRAAIWESNTSIRFQKAIHRVRFKQEGHNRWFLFFLYMADKSDKLQAYFTGTGIQRFTGQSLHRLCIPVPPISVVQRYVEKLDCLFDQTKNLEVVYNQKLHCLAELKQAILHKAFASELIAQPEQLTKNAAA
jgi:type I restriction enzyme S subunit